MAVPTTTRSQERAPCPPAHRPSLRYSRTRPHVARERVRAELLAEAAGALVVTEADTFGALILADLAAAAAAADDGDHD